MKFTFKIQQYQSDAVESIVRTFNGQPFVERVGYLRDRGVTPPPADGQQVIVDAEAEAEEEMGYRNELIALNDEQLLANIHQLQQENNIKQSKALSRELGRCNLDVEMETGTGKTYVYIKTMFELNRRYGWSKFIIVVPSIAIREGVRRSFEVMQDHFMEHYGKKVRSFVYNSSNLHQLDSFSTQSGIQVMIINTQAFAKSLKEGGKSKESLIIYSKRDEFQSRRPIDVISANRPILILDEPQRMGGGATQTALQGFNPLFTLNFSATHAIQHNLIYVLDALDAYNKRLVKKIEVKGVELKNLQGTSSYLYLEDIILSSKEKPKARIEMEIRYLKSTNREKRIIEEGDSLYHRSNEMEQYRGYTLSSINPATGELSFTNGVVLKKGEVQGDVSENHLRRVQIRETIRSHFDKEEQLFNQGIKTLSLFFIDEVAKYRSYDEAGEPIEGAYAKLFDQEYHALMNEKLTLEDTPYQRYLRKHGAVEVRNAYFSIDKKTSRAVDSETKRGAEGSDDITAYDLILKNKERLLSFEEPTRFIFSHSALREGWDNPNVFQICALKHSDNATLKRQEVGRGMRLCVDQAGVRMDSLQCGERVHAINRLTVVASESYQTFVGDLQRELKEVLYNRTAKATENYFVGKRLQGVDGVIQLTKEEAKAICRYLIKNDYVDNQDNITLTYRTAQVGQQFAPLPETLQPIHDEVHRLIQGLFDDSVLHDMYEDGNKSKIDANPLNENFHKKEFQALWKQINRKFAYRVEFESEELIAKAVAHIDLHLTVAKLQYQLTRGEQEKSGADFTVGKTMTDDLTQEAVTTLKYDLVGRLAEGCTLRRATVVAILKQIAPAKLLLFSQNPEEFISKTIRLIKEQKATMVVEHISYNQIEGSYDSSIFTAEKQHAYSDRSFAAQKHIQDFVITDGLSEKSVERRFAEALDTAAEVSVFAKLPKGFAIPTPVGNYSPDWAIAFNEGTVKHIYFIAETKGSMESLQLRPIEQAKISCASKLFNSLSGENLRYYAVSSYDDLMGLIK